MWFPNFNDYFTACSKRHKKLAAIKDAQKDPEALEVLQDHELPILLQATDMGNAMEAQRWFAVIIGRCSGWRPDSLMAVDVENFRIISEGGKRYLQPVLGSMKNLPASFNNVDKALFKQRIGECADTKFCPIVAFERQLSLLPEGKGALFRAVSLNSKKSSDKRGGYGIFRGASNWVGEVVGRPDLTYKDIARRVAITKLCNSGIPQAEVAAYLGVRTNTLDVYFRSALGIPNQAANILSKYAPNPKVEVDASSAPSANGGGSGADGSGASGAGAASSASGSTWGLQSSTSSTGATGSTRLVEEVVAISHVPSGRDCVSAIAPPEYIDVDESWDHEQFGPLSQYAHDPPAVVKVEEESCSDEDSNNGLSARLEAGRRVYKQAAYAAPASPPGAPVNQDLSRTPDPFVPGRKRAKPNPNPNPNPKPKPKPKMTKPKPPPKASPVAKPKPKVKPEWACCYVCNEKIDPKSHRIVDRGITCDGCYGSFHLKCAKLRVAPRFNSFPCPLGCNPRDHDGH